jgi:hypothetical protein
LLGSRLIFTTVWKYSVAIVILLAKEQERYYRITLVERRIAV